MTPERRNTESTLTGYSPPLLKPRNSLRWWVFVLAKLAAYAATCLFWHYVQSGSWADFHGETFRRDLRVSLGQVLLEPLGIFTHPWMILIVAALLAALIAVPLATAVMYPLLLAMVFVGMTAVLAHAPWLALSLALGCLLTARSRLRREYPYLAALLGFLPVGLYLYLLTYAGLDATLLLPLHRWLLAVPFTLATVLTVFFLSLVVRLARWGKFQPGVIWPILLLLPPAAAGIFYTQIGPAELRYVLLVQPLAPGEALLPSLPREEYHRRHAPGLNERALEARLDEELLRQRRRLEQQCETFLRSCPRGERAPSVAWLAAQAQSLQRDRRPGSEAMILYTSAWPTSKSVGAWRRLLTDYGDAPPAAIARWRLGELTLRETADQKDDSHVLLQAAEADKLLQSARNRLREFVERLREEESHRQEGIFSRYPSLPRLDVYEHALFETEVLVWRIERNDVLRDARCARALGKLLAINPYLPDYARRVKQLAAEPEFQNTPMADNLRLAVAKLCADPYDRLESLLPLAADQRTDSSIEAHFELGRLTLQTTPAWATPLPESVQTPETYFKIVVAAPPNPWQPAALENLRWLQSSAAPRQKP